MNPWIGWALAAAAMAAGWIGWGWKGLVLAFTVTAFWLLLQFSRALRALRGAAQRPVGQVPSAVMLHAKLADGMTMLQVVALTRSLGERVSAEAVEPEVWRWRDEGGVTVDVTLRGGRVRAVELRRPPAPEVQDSAP